MLVWKMEWSKMCPEVLVLNHMEDDDSLGSGSSSGVELLRQSEGLAGRRCLTWAWEFSGWSRDARRGGEVVIKSICYCKRCKRWEFYL